MASGICPVWSASDVGAAWLVSGGGRAVDLQEVAGGGGELKFAQCSVQAATGENFQISTGVRDRVLNDKTSLLLVDALSDSAFAERARSSFVCQTTIADEYSPDKKIGR